MTRLVLLGAALAGIGMTAGAQTIRADVLTVGKCRVDLAPPWTKSGGSAVAPGGSTVRVLAVPSPKMVIDLLDPDFRRIQETPVLLYARARPNNGRQFRSVTRGAPGCAVDVDALTPEAVAPGEAIARSIARIP